MTNLITLAGEGLRFVEGGAPLPKPLIKIGGIPMIVRAIKCLPSCDKYVFVCRKEHVNEFEIDKLLEDVCPGCEIIQVTETTQGQACTAELGINESSIEPDDEILISCCDYGLTWNKNDYESVKQDSDVVVWSTTNNTAFCNNPDSYSWLTLDDRELLYTSVKKYNLARNPFYEHAIVGTFYFKKARYFLDSVQTIYEKRITSNGEYYIDNIFNTITDLDVNVFPVDRYYCWGTPKDLEDYEYTVLGRV